MNRLGTFGIDFDIAKMTKGAADVVKAGQVIACVKETEEIDKLKTQRILLGLGGLVVGAVLGVAYSKMA